MNSISQRTIVEMMKELEILQRGSVYRSTVLVLTGPTFEEERNKFWNRVLFENGFPETFIRHAEEAYEFDWDSILRQMRTSEFFYRRNFDAYVDFGDGNILGEYTVSRQQAQEIGEIISQRLAAFICTFEKSDRVRRSLEQDGFQVDISRLKLVPLEGAVSEKEEEDRLTRLIRESYFLDEAKILKHIADAASLYRDGKDHPSLNESRSLLQALVDDIAEETNKSGVHKRGLPSGTKNRITYLREVGFLTEDEEAANRAAWGVLSAGSHPGIPLREEARIGLILALEFSQLLVLKFQVWRQSGFVRI